MAQTGDDIPRRRRRWHIAVFLAPAVLVYSAIMVIPLFGTLYQSFFTRSGGAQVFTGFDNFRTLFGNPRWSAGFWNALGNNLWFFVIHMAVQNPIGILLAALLSSPRLRFKSLYRSLIFIPTILSFVIVGFVWKLILLPLWGIAPNALDAVGLGHLFRPWLGMEDYALITLSLVSVWQFVGIPMMLIYAALLSIPDSVIEAAECDGVTGMAQFWKIQLPLVRPAMVPVAVFTMIPIWNDLWFPLILAPSEATKPVTLGAQVFIGQFVINWNAVLAALSLAILPVLVLYLIFSRQLIRGITSGAVK